MAWGSTVQPQGSCGHAAPQGKGAAATEPCPGLLPHHPLCHEQRWDLVCFCRAELKKLHGESHLHHERTLLYWDRALGQAGQ